MIEKVLKLRSLYLIVVIFTLISSVCFVIMGVLRSIHGYIELIKLWTLDGYDGTPGTHLAEGLDAFLIALVFLVFGLGIMRIFTHYDSKIENLPAWLNISSFKELKVLLWETILVTLVVVTISSGTLNPKSVTWNALIMPCVILILSISLFIMKKEDH